MPGAPTNGIDAVGRFAERPIATAAMAVWATAEAIFLPVVPDVGLCLLVLAAPRHAPRLFAAVIAGALAGTIVLAGLTAQGPDGVRTMLLALPGIDGAVLATTDASLARDGVAAFGQFGPGAPLKVFTFEWLARGGDIPSLLLGAVLNRLTRIGPALIAAAVIGWFVGPWLRRHWRLTFLAYAATWIAVYTLYLLPSG